MVIMGLDNNFTKELEFVLYYLACTESLKIDKCLVGIVVVNIESNANYVLKNCSK